VTATLYRLRFLLGQLLSRPRCVYGCLVHDWVMQSWGARCTNCCTRRTLRWTPVLSPPDRTIAARYGAISCLQTAAAVVLAVRLMVAPVATPIVVGTGAAVAAAAAFPPGSAAVAFALRTTERLMQGWGAVAAAIAFPPGSATVALHIRWAPRWCCLGARSSGCSDAQAQSPHNGCSVHAACTGQTSGRGAVAMAATPPTYGCGAAREWGRRAVAGLSP
jgi:hypothetical protein